MFTELELTLALAAGILLTSGMLMWRGSASRNRIARRDPLRENEREQQKKSKSPEGLLHEMEVRLFDYGREVEGRVETTLNVLDRLIIDAESEIDRLEDLLNLSRADRVPENKAGSLDENSLARITELRQAGLADEEIARCLQCDVSLVRNYLDDGNQDRRAA
ncbi:hypothetical protein [Rubinisphaera italica]|uniref:DUF2802 domain-containing protein n=1 Tax=Rubinisphaera italica TaxID=2527969 RepID=A0A5C5XMA6_9PLAN|nr:hypothetical protein [Rubinisphaera italica]TWT64090.1 hypothetical protein Pan54_48510 [Rubinisphaera italica]